MPSLIFTKGAIAGKSGAPIIELLTGSGPRYAAEAQPSVYAYSAKFDDSVAALVPKGSVVVTDSPKAWAESGALVFEYLGLRHLEPASFDAMVSEVCC